MESQAEKAKSIEPNCEQSDKIELYSEVMGIKQAFNHRTNLKKNMNVYKNSKQNASALGRLNINK